MRTAGTLVAVVLALLWSALVWGGYGLLLISADFVADNAGNVGLPPEMAGWAGMLDGLLQDYGTAIAAAVWALGLLAIFALRAVFNLLIGAARPRDVEPAPRHAVRLPEVQRPQPARPASPPPAAAPAPPPAVAPAPVVVAPPEPARWGRDAAR